MSKLGILSHLTHNGCDTGKKMGGFSLLELLAVLAIGGILLLMAMPSGRSLLVQNRTKVQTDTLISGLNFARTEAIIRGEKLIFCKSADQITCGGQWRDGQIVVDLAGQVLRVFPPLAPKDNLIWNSSAGKDAAITWLPTGYTNGQRGTFYLCVASSRAADSRRIVLLDTGRSYTMAMSAQEKGKYCLSSAGVSGRSSA